MSKYTAEQVEDYAQACALIHKGPVIAELLHEYATLLRERESAKAAVTDEMAEHVIEAFVGDIYPLDYTRTKSVKDAMSEAVAPMLASARVPDVDLVERCKEVLAWKSTGLLRGDYLREYAKAAPNHDDDLQWAEEQTKTQAMRVLAAAPKARDNCTKMESGI